MDLGVYRVVKEANEWMISAGGVGIMACRDRRTAMRTVQRAAELLRRSQIASPASVPGDREAGDSANLDGQATRATNPGGYDFPATTDPA